MLIGQPPFTGDNNMAVMAQRLTGDAPRLDKKRSEVDPHLAAVVARALQRDPKERYADMRAFIAALEHPETADITLLERLQIGGSSLPWWRSTAFRSVMIAVVVMAALVILAVVLQSLHH